MVIVCFHVLLPQLSLHGFVLRVLDHSYLAVDLFFVLSGFVLGLQVEPLGWWQAWRGHPRFMRRRFARVWPLYALTTLWLWSSFQLGWTWWQPDYHHPLATLAVSMTLLQCLGLGMNINLVAWSLSTEWIAYLIFPLLAGLAFHGRKLWPVALLAGSVGCLATICYGIGPSPSWLFGRMNVSDSESVLPVLRCVSGFSLGLLTSRLARTMQDPAPPPWLGAALAAAVIYTASVPDAELVTVLLFPPLILALTARRDVLARVLGSAVPRFVGLISYSLYVVHTPVSALRASGAAQDWLYAHWSAAMPVSIESVVRTILIVEIILTATILHFCVEKPARAWLSPRSTGLAAQPRRTVPRDDPDRDILSQSGT